MRGRLCEDEAAVRGREAAYDAAWQAGDVAGLLACLSDDAVLVSPRGEVTQSHAAIERELEALLGGWAQGSTHVSSISRVAFVTPDVAVVDGQATVEWKGQGERGSVLPHRFTDVLVRKNGSWLIAHIRACWSRDEPEHPAP